MVICTIHYVDKEHARGKASCVSHHDIFTVNFMDVVARSEEQHQYGHHTSRSAEE